MIPFFPECFPFNTTQTLPALKLNFKINSLQFTHFAIKILISKKIKLLNSLKLFIKFLMDEWIKEILGFFI